MAGQIFDVTLSYSAAFVILSVLMGVGLTATLLLRPVTPQSRNRA